MWSEDCVIVWNAGWPRELATDATGPAGSTESVVCTKLLEGVGWATDDVASGVSAEPPLTAVYTEKAEAKSLSAAGEAPPRPGELSTLVTDAETRATNLLEGAARSSTLIRGRCVRKSQTSAGVKGTPPKAVLSVRDTSPPKPTPGIGEEGVSTPQVLMRYMPPSSTGVKLLDTLRSCSVTGSVKRDRQSALPSASLAVLRERRAKPQEVPPTVPSADGPGVSYRRRAVSYLCGRYPVGARWGSRPDCRQLRCASPAQSREPNRRRG